MAKVKAEKVREVEQEVEQKEPPSHVFVARDCPHAQDLNNEATHGQQPKYTREVANRVSALIGKLPKDRKNILVSVSGSDVRVV